MEKRKLGRQGLEVSALGLGCMGMSWAYGGSDESQSIRVLHHALDIGVNFWDTAETYGPFTNEELIGRALAGKRREDVVIATKFAWKFGPNQEQIALDSSPANIKQSIEGSLRRLRTSYIDLYYQHRLDPNTPIEDTVRAMAELVKEGKIRYIGLSEAAPQTLRRAAKVHPITALQTEYSLWTRDPEDEVLPTCRELGIGFVAYSPLGRGFLTGQFKRFEDLAADDYRRLSPRFQGENFQKNLELVSRVEAIAKEKGCTPARLALAWVLAQGEDIVPIPGTKRRKYLEDNVGALNVQLTPEDLRRLDEIFPHGAAAGPRYPEAMMKVVNQ